MKKPSIKDEKKLIRQERLARENKKNFLLIVLFTLIIFFIIFLCVSPAISLSYTNESNTKYKYYIHNIIITK